VCKTVIDVSRHQGVMNWARAANAGCVAAVARATKGLQGPNYPGYDEQFVANWAGMKSEGIRRGAYHLFMPELDPKKQADWFVSIVQDQPEWAVVDVELNVKAVPRATFWERLLECCIRIDRYWPGSVVIYTRASFWGPVLGGAPWPLGKLWVAHYTQAARPVIPQSWGDWLLWQYSADENRRGGEFGAQSAAIDLSRYNGRL
jgi:lysozyme